MLIAPQPGKVEAHLEDAAEAGGQCDPQVELLGFIVRNVFSYSSMQQAMNTHQFIIRPKTNIVKIQPQVQKVLISQLSNQNNSFFQLIIGFILHLDIHPLARIDSFSIRKKQ